MSDSVVATQRAFDSISTGKQVNQDSWMTMWCNTNWGELLQPAPLSIALLGSVMILASSTDDFSLLTEHDPQGRGPAVTWTYAKYPDSFKTCLQQMVGEGYTAFEGAHANMNRILNATSQMPREISNAVGLIVTGTSNDIKIHLRNQIDAVLKLANICQEAAADCEGAFKNISGLSEELTLACTHKVGNAEQVLQANKVHLAVIAQEKEMQEQTVNDAKSATQLMKTSFENAEKDFRSAMDQVPSGFNLIAMNYVEGLCNVAASAANIPLAVASRIAHCDLSSGGQEPAWQQASTFDSPRGPNAVLDGGAQYAKRILDHVKSIDMLMTGGSYGGPDWNSLRSTGGENKTGTFVKYDLGGILNTLRKQGDDKEISQKLIVQATKALDILEQMLRQAGSVDRSDDSFKKHESTIARITTRLEEVVTEVNLLLQQPGISAKGPGTPAPLLGTNSAAAKSAVENARFKVDQTRANLTASRDSFDSASKRLMASQKEITETISKMTSLKLMNGGIEEMLPVLKNAVKAFTKLRAQFSQINQFFTSIAALLRDVMAPSVDRWARTMDVSSGDGVGGVSLSNYTRQLIYTQMMIPLKVSMLAEKISGTYLKVSDQYILPAQRRVGEMLSFAEDTSPAGKAQLKLKLERQQRALQDQCAKSSRQISALVEEDRKKFTAQIDQRLDSIVSTMKICIPSVEQPVPRAIASVAEAHVASVTLERQQEADGQGAVLNLLNDMM